MIYSCAHMKISFSSFGISVRVIFLRAFFGALYRTLKLWIIDEHGILIKAEKKEAKVLYAMFHDSYLIPFYINRHRDYVVFTATSHDGDVLTRLIEPQGYTVFRFPQEGDPKAAARATIEMINAIKKGHPAALTVDGPIGPCGKVKPGIFVIAEKSGATIYPSGVGMRHCITLKNRWDKFRVPLPFTKVVAISGEPFEWSHDLSEESLKHECLRLEHVMRELRERADILAKE